MSQHYATWIHFSPPFVGWCSLLHSDDFKKDPLSRSGERVEGTGREEKKKQFCTKIVLTGRISFSNSDPSSSIQTSPSWVLLPWFMPGDFGHTAAVGWLDASPARLCGSPAVRVALPSDDCATETDHLLLKSDILMGNHRPFNTRWQGYN